MFWRVFWPTWGLALGFLVYAGAFPLQFCILWYTQAGLGKYNFCRATFKLWATGGMGQDTLPMGYNHHINPSGGPIFMATGTRLNWPGPRRFFPSLGKNRFIGQNSHDGHGKGIQGLFTFPWPYAGTPKTFYEGGDSSTGSGVKTPPLLGTAPRPPHLPRGDFATRAMGTPPP